MKYFESVLAFGDSHVAGCELAGYGGLQDYSSGKITLEELDSPGKEFSFPKIVEDKLKVPCYNFAMTGGSNARSLRLLIDAVQKYPNSLVLFGYTCTDRTEFYYPDKGTFLGRDNSNFIQTGMQWEGDIKGVRQHPINDIFVKEILRPYNNLKELMFIVNSICTLYTKDFLHLPMFPEQLTATDKLFSFEQQENYLSWCKHNNFKQLPYLHYGQDAHNALADLIIKDLDA
jgi:hypothetical protein